MAVLSYPVSSNCSLCKGTLNMKPCTMSPWRIPPRRLPVCHQLSSLMFSKSLGAQKLLTVNGPPLIEVDHQGKLCSWKDLSNSLSFRADPEGSARLR